MNTRALNAARCAGVLVATILFVGSCVDERSTAIPQPIGSIELSGEGAVRELRLVDVTERVLSVYVEVAGAIDLAEDLGHGIAAVEPAGDGFVGVVVAKATRQPLALGALLKLKGNGELVEASALTLSGQQRPLAIVVGGGQ